MIANYLIINEFPNLRIYIYTRFHEFCNICMSKEKLWDGVRFIYTYQ